MLVETTFRIGAFVCLAAGFAEVGLLVVGGPDGAGYPIFAMPALFLVIGGIFLYVARDAARARRELLRSPRPPPPG